MTVVACGNAAGAAIPPMIIYEGKICKPECADNLPPDTLVQMSEKGSMITEYLLNGLTIFQSSRQLEQLYLYLMEQQVTLVLG